MFGCVYIEYACCQAFCTIQTTANDDGDEDDDDDGDDDFYFIDTVNV